MAAPGAMRMPLLYEVAPAALELAHLVDAAGGLDGAARLLGSEPEQVAAWLTGTSPGLVPLATGRLARRLGEQSGWSTSAPVLRAVA